MGKIDTVLIAALLSGCASQPQQPDVSLIMPPPVPVRPAEEIAVRQQSQASTDRIPLLTLGWTLPEDATPGDAYIVFFTPVKNNLENWSAITNIAWPANSIILPASNGFYRIKVRTAAGFLSN